jgi:cytochrome bd-type quinol oxidase subunit 2
MSATDQTRPRRGRKERGFASLLIVVYAILAIAATGRAGWELATKFTDAPLPYALSLVAAVTYLVVTVLLIRRGADSRAALWVCCFELLGIVVVGTLTVAAPDLFPTATVWTHYGAGYGFVPMILPIAAITYLALSRRTQVEPVPADATGNGH